MGGNNRQRKSSGLFSVFNVFKPKKSKGGYYEGNDDGMKTRRIWPSDEDKGCWGVAEPNIDMKAEAFISQYKKRVSESEHVQVNPPPAVAVTATGF